MPSQNARILAYLQAGHTLTALEALEWFNCFRLSARIYDLRRAGHDIRAEIVMYGDKSVARYWLPRQRRQLGLLEPAQKSPDSPLTSAHASQ